MTVRTAAAPRTHLDTLAIWSGLLGSSVIALGSIVTAIAYQGSQGQPYSPLNHFVSELGERAESELAVVFNTSLIIGGVCFVLFILGLAFVRRSRLRYAYGPLGVIAGVGGAFVGVFPMDYLDQHAVAALTFFNLGWIVVALASIDFVRNPDWRFPSWLAIIGAATVVAFVVFLVLLSGEGGSLAHPTDRPDVWPLVIFEWLLLAGILVWVFATAFTWWRATRVPKRVSA
jgi:hypothetical membrane protein